jgi:CheY-like chemotaxis protein
MFTHQQVWDAIEALARARGWSLSRLAVRAGLDPTALNRSKRAGFDGKPRWPSTETLAKLLSATDITLGAFCRLVERAPEAAEAAPREQAEAVRGNVLLVEDDAFFRESSAKGLRQAGFTVHTAADHRGALDILDDERPIDVMCTDVVMPDGLGGVALARLARLRRPNLKIIYVTGYEIPGLADHAKAPVLQKPVMASQLVAEIGRLIGPTAAK